MIRGNITVKSFDITLSCLEIDNRTIYLPLISDMGLTSVDP